MTPRQFIKELLLELPELRRQLLSKSQMPAVHQLDRWRRHAEHALGERSTGEMPAMADDEQR
ncbi:MAG TPA: hypothetical protein VFG69_01655 [Nannocystaceae bacterium]|nr:hypothetical protein [Nannocystaceae bacterium]